MILTLKKIQKKPPKNFRSDKHFQQSSRIQNQKSVVFLYTNNEHFSAEKEITSIPFTIATKIKYLGISLNREVKDLYNEN
jgi:hypothetical protein